MAIAEKLMPIIRKETAVVKVPNAYKVGVVTVVVIPKISNGRVFFEPMESSDRANSSKLNVKPNKPTPTRLGPMIGMITC